MANKHNNTVGNLTNPNVNTKLVLPPLKLSPLPEKLLKIVPEMKDWLETNQRAIDEHLVKSAIAIRGNAS